MVMTERMQGHDGPLVPRELPPAALRRDAHALIAEVRDALVALPAGIGDGPEMRALSRAAAAGPGAARAIIEVAGGAAVAVALMQASATFRATGHFRESDLLERLAFVVAGWERRARPRTG
jgi:hypothetical protein